VRAEFFIRMLDAARRQWDEQDVSHVPILCDQVQPRICFIRITSSYTHVSVSDMAPQNSNHL